MVKVRRNMVKGSQEDIVEKFKGEREAVAKEGVGVVAKVRRNMVKRSQEDIVEKPEEKQKAVVQKGVGGVAGARPAIFEK